ncbi:response regulator [bacterium]
MSERKRILLVEDEPDIANVAIYWLEDAGYEVIHAENGQIAMEKVRSEKPDMVFLDIQIPIMTGDEVCAAIKTDDDLKHIPVVIVSASVDNIETKVAEAGGNAFLTKPFEEDGLLGMAQKYTQS